MKTQLSAGFFGEYDLSYYVVAFIFGAIGFFLYKWLTFKKAKDKNDLQFSPSYWIQNNWADVIAGFLFFFVWIRFKNDILDAFQNEALVIFFKSVTDSFFAHLVFGMLATHVSKVLRSYFQTLDK